VKTTWVILSVERLPSEVAATYQQTGKVVTKVETDGSRFRVTSDSGRTVLWTRQTGVRPWKKTLL
jgi:hypothetical protein